MDARSGRHWVAWANTTLGTVAGSRTRTACSAERSKNSPARFQPAVPGSGFPLPGEVPGGPTCFIGRGKSHTGGASRPKPNPWPAYPSSGITVMTGSAAPARWRWRAGSASPCRLAASIRRPCPATPSRDGRSTWTSLGAAPFVSRGRKADLLRSHTCRTSIPISTCMPSGFIWRAETALRCAALVIQWTVRTCGCRDGCL